jgi:ABC-type transporter Mla MlaB component
MANDVQRRTGLCLERDKRCHHHSGDHGMEQPQRHQDRMISPAPPGRSVDHGFVPKKTIYEIGKKGELMWKVQRTDDGGLLVLLVSGRIEREHLTKLREVFTAETGNRNVILDMKEVKLVDQEAITFLAHCEESGAELRNCPAYIREWMERRKQTECSSYSR